MRRALLSALRLATVSVGGSRQSALGNDAMLGFWGLTNHDNNLAAALLAGLPIQVGRPPDGAIRKPKRQQDDDDARIFNAPAGGRPGTRCRSRP